MARRLQSIENNFENEPKPVVIAKLRQASAKQLASIFQTNLFVRNLKINVFLMMSSICSTLEYCTLIHFDTHFDPKVILVNML